MDQVNQRDGPSDGWKEIKSCRQTGRQPGRVTLSKKVVKPEFNQTFGLLKG